MFIPRMLISFSWLHSGLSASREEYRHPKLMGLAPTWSRRCESTTGLPTGGRKRLLDKNWLWMPTVGQRTVWTLSFRTVPHITRKTAVPHQARCKVLTHSVQSHVYYLIFPLACECGLGSGNTLTDRCLHCDMVWQQIWRRNEVVDEIRGKEREQGSDQWEWQSELSKWHCYSQLWNTHQEQSALYLQSQLHWSQQARVGHKEQPPLDRTQGQHWVMRLNWLSSPSFTCRVTVVYC